MEEKELLKKKRHKPKQKPVIDLKWSENEIEESTL